VCPRGDAVLEERLKKNFLGIKLIYKEKLFWIHSVEFRKKKGKNDITLFLSTSITSEYFSLVYTLVHSINGHVSFNITSAVLIQVLMIKTMNPLGILGIFVRTADADEEEIILCEKGTIESKYDNDFEDGED
jgi:hypothetical protein